MEIPKITQKYLLLQSSVLKSAVKKKSFTLFNFTQEQDIKRFKIDIIVLLSAWVE